MATPTRLDARSIVISYLEILATPDGVRLFNTVAAAFAQSSAASFVNLIAKRIARVAITDCPVAAEACVNGY
jgi:hypothetical protein